MWFGLIQHKKCLYLSELYHTESQTEYFSINFWDFRLPNHRPNHINDIYGTESESANQKLYISKTESESEPNLSLQKLPNPNHTDLNLKKNRTESESDFTFSIFLRIYDSVTESYDSSITENFVKPVPKYRQHFN